MIGVISSSPEQAKNRRCTLGVWAAMAAMALLLQACGTVDPQITETSASLPPASGSPSYSSSSKPATDLSQADLSKYDTVGVASWYGKPYHGRRTASGKVYNMNQLTAAHPTLPFGTRVAVTNLENGRTVIVTINDRGPFKPNRIIDVSRKAAGQLGFLNQGLTRVRVVASTQD